MVLLKNEKLQEGNPVLPLTKGKKILLTGPNANQMRCLNGGWSYTWQGHGTDERPGKYNTIYEAFCNEYGKENVILNQGVTYNEKGKYWEENNLRFKAQLMQQRKLMSSLPALARIPIPRLRAT